MVERPPVSREHGNVLPIQPHSSGIHLTGQVGSEGGVEVWGGREGGGEWREVGVYSTPTQWLTQGKHQQLEKEEKRGREERNL